MKKLPPAHKTALPLAKPKTVQGMKMQSHSQACAGYFAQNNRSSDVNN
jgi:hypothetical protein